MPLRPAHMDLPVSVPLPNIVGSDRDSHRGVPPAFSALIGVVVVHHKDRMDNARDSRREGKGIYSVWPEMACLIPKQPPAGAL